MHLDLRVRLAILCPKSLKHTHRLVKFAHFACIKIIDLPETNLHLGRIGSLRHLAHKLTELVSVDLLLVLRDHVRLLLLLLLEARARILTGLVVRIRRLRRFVVNVYSSCPAASARRLFAVSRLWRLHLLLVVHPVHIRASTVVLLRGSHLLTPTPSVLLLLLSQLLLRVMHTSTGARLVALRFEIILHLMAIVLVHHCLRVLNLLSLVELMVIVVRLARVVLHLVT